MKWYLKAAEQGYGHAQDNLGYMYEHGVGVPTDYREALKWYQKAAAQGNASGRKHLDSMHRRGLIPK